MVREQEIAVAVSRSEMLRWLKKHAMRLPAGPLTPAQERDIAECFKLLDEDGSGALDISELVKAFKLLGFKADRASVKAMMKQVQGENREELQQHEFRALMAHSLSSGSHSSVQASDASPMSFQEVARATKRTKDLEAVMAGGTRRQDFIDKTSSPVTTARSTRSKRCMRAGLPKLAQAAASDQQRADAVSMTAERNVQLGPALVMSNDEAGAVASELILQNLEVPWGLAEPKVCWHSSRSKVRRPVIKLNKFRS